MHLVGDPAALLARSKHSCCCDKAQLQHSKSATQADPSKPLTPRRDNLKLLDDCEVDVLAAQCFVRFGWYVRALLQRCRAAGCCWVAPGPWSALKICMRTAVCRDARRR